MDKLEKLFDKQYKLQKKLNYSLNNKNARVIMILAAIDELTEALREIPWKPWKKHQKFNSKKFQEEIIDLWHFVINLSIAGNMNAEDVYNKFIYKNNINKKRIKNNY